MIDKLKTFVSFTEDLEYYRTVERKGQYDFVDQICKAGYEQDEMIRRTVKDYRYILEKIDQILDCTDEASLNDISIAVLPYIEKLTQYHALLTMLVSNYTDGFPGSFI